MAPKGEPKRRVKLSNPRGDTGKISNNIEPIRGNPNEHIYIYLFIYLFIQDIYINFISKTICMIIYFKNIYLSLVVLYFLTKATIFQNFIKFLLIFVKPFPKP